MQKTISAWLYFNSFSRFGFWNATPPLRCRTWGEAISILFQDSDFETWATRTQKVGELDQFQFFFKIRILKLTGVYGEGAALKALFQFFFKIRILKPYVDWIAVRWMGQPAHFNSFSRFGFWNTSMAKSHPNWVEHFNSFSRFGFWNRTIWSKRRRTRQNHISILFQDSDFETRPYCTHKGLGLARISILFQDSDFETLGFWEIFGVLFG